MHIFMIHKNNFTILLLILLFFFSFQSWAGRTMTTEDITLENGETITIRRNPTGQIVGRSRRELDKRGMLEKYDVPPPPMEEEPITEEQRRDVEFMWQRQLKRYERGMGFTGGPGAAPESGPKTPWGGETKGIIKIEGRSF